MAILLSILPGGRNDFNCYRVSGHQSHRNILKEVKHVWTLTFQNGLQCDIGHEKWMRAISDDIKNV